jgi:predicted RNA-binding Zn-ribbon protein involved in translation (DUF1610 family)
MPARNEAVRKDCPLCGESMVLKESRDIAPVPGNPGAMMRTLHEWICPECDYFEEVGAEGP